MVDGIPEVFCDCVQSVEIIGPCARITLTAGPDIVAPADRQPTLCLILPIERLPQVLQFLAQWCTISAGAEVAERVSALLH